ncbi:hypothetical protein CEUSTIGMA_g6799.t1 [Chlamydomonas eustigma]|uniref:Uncharacterized protein n=1 Tax=Chlamydomonas eustigma TaxID=1157962 RepID=A0A250X8G9_9CHLO|nr:hypothetical protein CEUSTIGMA_g6799.t1 [Chlamydomonas eustigma]|eukprot:GAX79357.1 hypothetical protein CEUSTIGMA_g6799.t1 [Chlamydomonas eustigma]
MFSAIRRSCSFGTPDIDTQGKLVGQIEAAIECQTFEKIEAFIASEKFLDKLSYTGAPIAECSTDVAEQISDAMASNITANNDFRPAMLPMGPTKCDDETLMSCPEASTMPPAKLHEAIIIAVQSMKQAKFKQLCAVGWHVYRWSALGYSAFQMYTNPWIVQGIIRALFALSRMTMRSWM